MKTFFLLFVMICMYSRPLDAGTLTVNVGPVALGGGGSNPVSVPPTQPVEYSIMWVTEKNNELRFGLSPGIFFWGFRSGAKNGLYVSAGPGLVLNANGAGPGVFSAFGFNSYCKFFCYNVEYMAAIGFAGDRTFNPYAIRMGASFYF